MAAALLITLRETLEASLVVGILLAYLKKTQNTHHNKYIWSGVGAGVAISIALAYAFQWLYGGFEGRAEELYEGIMMLTAAGLLSWMIIWMLKQRHAIKKNIENKAAAHIKEDHPMGLFTLVFVAVLREGIETVIFLQGAVIASQGHETLLGAISGIALAIFLAWILFKGIAKVPLKSFFTTTSILLILFAAGLVAHGVHELQEAHIIPEVIEHVWDINPLVVTEGVYPLFHENGAIGSLLKGLFGYNGNPNLLEVVAYVLYLMVIALVWRKVDDQS